MEKKNLFKYTENEKSKYSCLNLLFLIFLHVSLFFVIVAHEKKSLKNPFYMSRMGTH